MGQKVNPHGLRVGVIKDWDSRWFARNEKVGDLIVEDKKIRDYLKKTLYGAGIPKIEIERDSAKVRIYLHCARPGMVIGKGGEDIKKYEAALVKLTQTLVEIFLFKLGLQQGLLGLAFCQGQGIRSKADLCADSWMVQSVHSFRCVCDGRRLCGLYGQRNLYRVHHGAGAHYGA